MKRNTFWLVTVAILVSNVAFTVTTTRDAKAQEVAPDISSAPEESKYTLKVPGGLAFSEFRDTRTGRLSPFNTPKT